MGRPKALRNRDVVKSVDIKKVCCFFYFTCTCWMLQSGTKITFDGSDDVIDPTPTEEATEKQSNILTSVDTSPEEVKNDNEEILSLKRLHEQMIDPAKRKPKRKTAKVVAETDEELDPSILNSLDEIGAVDEEPLEVPSSSGSGAPGRIDKAKSNSKKL